jgi:hypothetical protein
VLKKNVNESLFYPRAFTPAFICMVNDPLIDLQIWERVTYIVLAIFVSLYVSSMTIMATTGPDALTEEEQGNLWIITTCISLPVKLLVSNPMLALFLATKGRQELAKTDRCYQWWGWGLIFAVVFMPIFVGLGIVQAVIAANESYGQHTFGGIFGAVFAEFLFAEVTGPWIVSFYAVLKWLLVPGCVCCIFTKDKALQVTFALLSIMKSPHKRLASTYS